MKKTMLCLMLVLCLFLAGCGDNAVSNPTNPSSAGNAPMPGYDAQNQYLLVNAISFQETEDFFCGSNFTGEFLHFYDKESGISGVLCTDPACAHDSPSCGAYIRAGAMAFYYDGKLYYISGDSANATSLDYFLWRSDLSGRNREKVKRISFEDIILPYQPQQCAIHRGKLYMLGQCGDLEGTKTVNRVTLLSTPLDSSEEYTTVFEATVDHGIQPAMRFVGNAVYLSIMTFSEKEPYDLTVLKYDIETGTTETVFAEAGIPEIPGAIWVTAQGEIYVPGQGEQGAYVWKIADGKRVEVASWEGSDLGMPKILDSAIVFLQRIDGVHYADIRNLSGETIYSGELFPGEIPKMDIDLAGIQPIVVGGDADKLILNCCNMSEAGLWDYTLMLEVRNNMKPTVLWSSRE
ncbi:MAG TPA: hypothetical protein IAC31_06135 [Candidatus Faecousia intestinigallinarum]|nr:hypothetical protein [Candidatus Faecousia intestinigallinarum]